MLISGTLHFYSGEDRELFFVFDDDIAQELYLDRRFDIDDLETRRAYVSVGSDRFIHKRTLSFSRKQTEIKISLCSKSTHHGLGNLTALYGWFKKQGGKRPKPFAVIGSLKLVKHQGQRVWELRLTEPADLVAPPGLVRRSKTPAPERRSYMKRRAVLTRDLATIGRAAEILALSLAQEDYPVPEFSCLWRDTFLDSERIEIRKLGILADIDVWNTNNASATLFIEVKAQKVSRRGVDPAFYLSVGEWRSYVAAERARIPYHVWLFQYIDFRDLKVNLRRIELVVFKSVPKEWLNPDTYLVRPDASAGDRFTLT